MHIIRWGPGAFGTESLAPPPQLAYSVVTDIDCCESLGSWPSPAMEVLIVGAPHRGNGTSEPGAVWRRRRSLTSTSAGWSPFSWERLPGVPAPTGAYRVACVEIAGELHVVVVGDYRAYHAVRANYFVEETGPVSGWSGWVDVTHLCGHSATIRDVSVSAADDGSNALVIAMSTFERWGVAVTRRSAAGAFSPYVEAVEYPGAARPYPHVLGVALDCTVERGFSTSIGELRPPVSAHRIPREFLQWPPPPGPPAPA